MPTHGSLFSGVGGMDLGFERAGYDTVFQVEWDLEAASILERHWPNVPRWEDVSDVDGADLPTCDVLSFGSPCQDLSIAGNRAGLAGEKSGLFHEAIRIIGEMRAATDGRFPRFVVWENVAGALSSARGADFASVIDLMADAGALVVEWAVLDARWFGVPQRRRRIFLVAVFDPSAVERCPDPILPVGTRSERDSEESTSAEQVVAALTATGVGTCGADDNQAQAGHLIAAFDSTRSGAFPINTDDVSPTLKVGAGIGASPPAVAISENQRAEVLITPYARSLSVGGGKPGQGYPAVLAESSVRRLTPIECERLMGWPDDHTRYRGDGTEQADMHRYKQCGNGVASPVATWVAGHVAKILDNNTTKGEEQ